MWEISFPRPPNPCRPQSLRAAGSDRSARSLPPSLQLDMFFRYMFPLAYMLVIIVFYALLDSYPEREPGAE